MNWLKANQWKIYSILLAVGMVALTILYIVKYEQIKKALVYDKVYNVGKDSLRKYVSTKGDTVYLLSEKMKEELTEPQLKTIDSLEDVLKLKPKEVVKYISIDTKTDLSKGSAKIDSVAGDSIRYYSYADSHKDYEAVSTPTSLKFTSFNVYDSIHAFFVRKKVGNKYFNEFNIINSNPDVKITKLSNVQFEEVKEKSRFSIGLSVGYNPFTKKATASIGLNYDLIRFNKKKK